MRQLTSLDTQFLALDTAGSHGHVAELKVLDPSACPGGTLTSGDLQRVVAARLDAMEPFRWRLVDVPLGLSHPYWVECSEVEVEYHVRAASVRAPGEGEELSDLVARLIARPLDMDRPPWEIYVVEGLASGHVAVLSKIHHALVDALAGMAVLGELLDTSSDSEPEPASRDGHHAPRPEAAEMLARGLGQLPTLPLRGLRSARRAMPFLDQTSFRSAPGVGTLSRAARRVEALVAGRNGRPLELPGVGVPRVPFNRRLSPRRRVAVGSLPLDDVKAIKDETTATVNDVVVTLCSGAVRRYLLELGQLPDEPLVAMIPISGRTEEHGSYGNRIAFMFAPIATDEPDPRRRLERDQSTLSWVKGAHEQIPPTLQELANDLIPPPLSKAATRAALALAGSGRLRPSANLAISNVPGPQDKLFLAGASLLSHHPFGPVFDSVGVNISVYSYRDHLDFGIIADAEQVPDPGRLMEYLHGSLEELSAAVDGRSER